MSDILPEIRSQIEHVIVTDEGGWILSSDPDGGDNGWTYAGVTSSTWKANTSIHLDTISFNTTPAYQLEDIKEEVIRIYYEKYYLPVWKIASDIDPYSKAPINTFELSCAVNCGLEGYKEVLLACFELMDDMDTSVKQPEGYYFRKAFCEAWKSHYDDIIEAKPEKEQFVHGWYNRVDRYLKD